MNVFLWNARARNGHVEATLNHPFPAQVWYDEPALLKAVEAKLKQAVPTMAAADCQLPDNLQDLTFGADQEADAAESTSKYHRDAMQDDVAALMDMEKRAQLSFFKLQIMVQGAPSGNLQNRAMASAFDPDAPPTPPPQKPPAKRPRDDKRG